MKSFLLMGLALLGLTACGGSGEAPTDISSGPSAAQELSITSNSLINAYGSNICTSSGNTCLFSGGQIVQYSDGTVFITGGWVFAFSGTSDTDSDTLSATMILPPDQSNGFIKLGYATISSATHAVYLLYVRSSGALQLVFDTNGSNSVNSDDQVITNLTTTAW